MRLINTLTNKALRMDAVSRLIYWQGDERYILPFSRDEVVHGKGTIINKLHGSMEDKFRQAHTPLLHSGILRTGVSIVKYKKGL